MANNVDISNLPTPEELSAAPKAADISGLPSPDQLGSQDTSHQFSTTGAFGQGALQGATAGFSDELGGALGALQEKVLPSGNADHKSLKDLYEEYRDMHRRRNDASQTQHPVANFAGNIAGGIVPGALTGGSIGGAAVLGATNGLGTSKADLVNPDTDQLLDAAKDTAIGGTVGAVAGAVGKGLSSLINPANLEAGGSKTISSALGVASKKEIPKIFNPETGQYDLSSKIVRGIGSTANDAGAIPMTGGPDAIYQKSQDAIKSTAQKIQPLLQQAQSQLDPALDDTLDSIGHLGDKAASFMQDYTDSIPDSSQKNAIVSKIFRTYAPQIEELSQNDGNLAALNQMKQGFQQTADSLNAYGDRKLGPEAQFVKQLGGIVRQHIEDLANASDSSGTLGDQVSDLNGTLSDLYTTKDAAAKAIQNPSKGSLGDLLSLGTKAVTGYDNTQAAGIYAGKAMLGTAKAIQTPLGKLVTNPAPVRSFISNPYSTQMAEKLSPSSNERLSSNLYNSTDDSLHEVASKMSQDPQVKHYGEALAKAITDNDEQGKNNAIFLILQNPTARKLLKPGT